MTIERSSVTGAYIIYTDVNGHLMTRTYFGYTKREAAAMFRAEVRAAR